MLLLIIVNILVGTHYGAVPKESIIRIESIVSADLMVYKDSVWCMYTLRNVYGPCFSQSYQYSN